MESSKAEKPKTKLIVHEVTFSNGIPTLSESAYHALLQKDIPEEQIQVALDNMSREMVKKALRSGDGAFQNIN